MWQILVNKSMTKIVLEPYDIKDNDEVIEIEKLCPQGGNLSLKFVRPTFHARSEVYEDYRILTAKMDGKIIGVTAAANKKVLMHNKKINAIYGYDLRVHPDFRKYGTAKILTKAVIEMFGDDIDCLYSFVSGENERALNFVKRNFGAKVAIPLTYLIIPVFGKMKSQMSYEVTNPTEIKNNYILQNPGMVFNSQSEEKYLLGHVNSIKIGNRAGCSIWTNENLISEQVDNLPFRYNMMRILFNTIKPFFRLPIIPKKNEILKSWFLYNLYSMDAGGIKEIISVLNNLAFSNGKNFLYILLQNDDRLLPLIKKSRKILFSQPYWFLAKGNCFPQLSDNIYIDIRDL